MKVSQEKIDQVREQIDIVDVIGDYVSLTKKGANYFGLCPFHNEKTPSFSVNQQKQIFHCFGCGAGGNVFTFIMEKENYSFIEAVKFLAERARIDLAVEESTPSEIARYRDQKIIYEINREAALFFYNNIKSEQGKEALEYLKKRRINVDIIKKFGIGVSPSHWDELYNSLKDKYPIDILEKSGLFISRKNSEGFFDRFRNRIMFPIINHMGKVIGFGGRTLGNEEPKYLNSPETLVYRKGYSLYGLNNIEIKREEPMILVEGYMDLLAFYKVGIKNVAAVLGTSLTQYQSRLIKRYSDTVITAFDGDDAGIKATLRNMEILKDEGINVRILEMPVGLDPDDLVNTLDIDGLKDKIKKSVYSIDFKLKNISSKIDTKTIEGKAKYISDIAPMLAELENAILREEYIKKIASETKISTEVIKEEVYKHKNQAIDKIGNEWHISEKNRNNIIDNNNKRKPYNRAYVKAQEDLLKLIIINPSNFIYVEGKLKPEEFYTKDMRVLAAKIFEHVKEGIEIIPADFINQLSDSKSLVNLATKILFENESEFLYEDYEKVISDFIKIINKENKEIKLQKILEKLKECQLKGDVQGEQNYLAEYQSTLKG